MWQMVWKKLQLTRIKSWYGYACMVYTFRTYLKLPCSRKNHARLVEPEFLAYNPVRRPTTRIVVTSLPVYIWQFINKQFLHRTNWTKYYPNLVTKLKCLRTAHICGKLVYLNVMGNDRRMTWELTGNEQRIRALKMIEH